MRTIKHTHIWVNALDEKVQLKTHSYSMKMVKLKRCVTWSFVLAVGTVIFSYSLLKQDTSEWVFLSLLLPICLAIYSVYFWISEDTRLDAVQSALKAWRKIEESEHFVDCIKTLDGYLEQVLRLEPEERAEIIDLVLSKLHKINDQNVVLTAIFKSRAQHPRAMKFVGLLEDNEGPV